ncbi:MAG: hydroxymethylglutaryl-CoA lyase [Bacteroidia bacterium]|jgi:hydroxymethylglutaryl-CoA lyase|nr:hydroxymethylglutaryl-CoA lyase [Bacteroidia bacterium]
MSVKIIECPRDAMQGLHDFIPTATKIKYINQLLQVGFDTIDFGSFVSPKAIPQLKDTIEVLEQLEWNTSTQLLAIVANLRGVEEAVKHNNISFIGFPFSISETFQQRNTNSSIAESLNTVKLMHEQCVKYHKQPVVYLSMGFGNPYGDEWSPEIAIDKVGELDAIGIRCIALSDTIGIADASIISHLFTKLIPAFPHIEFGAHLHTTPDTWYEKVDAAFNSGCNRFDGAIKGFGGCPMAADELTGNMPTEKIISYFGEKNISLGIDNKMFTQAMLAADLVFSAH